MLTPRHAAAALALTLLAVTPAAADPPQFGRHVTPLFYKLGCSAGGCPMTMPTRMPARP